MSLSAHSFVCTSNYRVPVAVPNRGSFCEWFARERNAWVKKLRRALSALTIAQQIMGMSSQAIPALSGWW